MAAGIVNSKSTASEIVDGHYTVARKKPATAGASQRLRPEGAKRELADEIPLGRTGDHAELANLASFLVSDHAGYINGATIAIDGGRQFLSDGGSSTTELLKWTPADWERMRAQARGGEA